jgi:hypothetical protein
MKSKPSSYSNRGTFGGYKILLLFYCLLSGLILLVSCKRRQAAIETIKSERVIDCSDVPKDSNTLFFPTTKLSSNTIGTLSKLNNEWYSKMLFALHEPVIFQSKDTAEVYRFLWLRSKHNPISIRIQKVYPKTMLTLKILEGAGGFVTGKLVRDTSFYISKNEWNIFKSKVTQIDFWNLSQTEIVDGKDGSEWVLEALNEGMYHFVDRWSPNETRNKDFMDLCEYLISLSKIELKESEVL